MMTNNSLLKTKKLKQKTKILKWCWYLCFWVCPWFCFWAHCPLPVWSLLPGVDLFQTNLFGHFASISCCLWWHSREFWLSDFWFWPLLQQQSQDCIVDFWQPQEKTLDKIQMKVAGFAVPILIFFLLRKKHKKKINHRHLLLIQLFCWQILEASWKGGT